jgi:hypothetical protein
MTDEAKLDRSDLPGGNTLRPGRIKSVQLAIAEDAESVDHLVKPEYAIRIAMARQQQEHYCEHSAR